MSTAPCIGRPDPLAAAGPRLPLEAPTGPRTLADRAFIELRDAILTVRLEPGQRLRLDEVAERLGMSVMPVRDALRRLEAASLVEVEPHRVATVARLSASELVEVFEPARGNRGGGDPTKRGRVRRGRLRGRPGGAAHLRERARRRGLRARHTIACSFPPRAVPRRSPAVARADSDAALGDVVSLLELGEAVPAGRPIICCVRRGVAAAVHRHRRGRSRGRGRAASALRPRPPDGACCRGVAVGCRRRLGNRVC